MIKQSPAQIYKSNLRGTLMTDKYSCLSTFNFGDYQEDSKKPFGSLQLLNQETLASKHKVSILIEANTAIYILPLYGGIDYKDSKGNESFIRIEQMKQIFSNENLAFELSNPFEENVSYLQIRLKAKAENFGSELNEFHLEERNSLISLFENNNALGFIGIYGGRKEGAYKLKNSTSGILVFIINGAFEFENRLIETGDALSLKEIEWAEWESLSENAILLLLEIPMHEL